MTIDTAVGDFRALIQESLVNGMDVVERLHQSVIAMPLEVATEFGLDQARAEDLTARHGRILRTLYGGVADGFDALGHLVEDQVILVTRFAGGIVQELIAEERADQPTGRTGGAPGLRVTSR